jgi:hypothetical protein
MENVPKFVRQRLQAPAAEPHPDANLLTAFAEQALPESERAAVIGHLADCGDCREVIALTLPVSEVASVTAVKGIGRGWLSLPILRWGVVAAGLVVLTSIGILQYREHRPQESRLAGLRTGDRAISAVENSKVSARPPAPVAPPQAPRPQGEMMMKKQAGRQGPALAGSERAVSSDRKRTGVGVGGGFGSGIGGATTVAATTPRPGSAGPTPEKPALTVQGGIPRASDVVEAEAQSAAVSTEPAQTSNQIAQNQANVPLTGRKVTNLDVVKAKDPEPAKAAATASPAMALQTQPAVTLPRWSISSTGALRRSFDAGKTWEDVSVTTASADSSAAMIVSKEDNAYEKASAARSSSDDKSASKIKRDEQGKQATLVFHSVAVTGSEVWAGAAGATLYHSVDGGAYWTRVVLAASGVALTGDITSIQFPDPQHGRIATSSGEVWTTDNDGQSWQKQ